MQTGFYLIKYLVFSFLLLFVSGCTPKADFDLLQSARAVKRAHKPNHHTHFEYYILPRDRVKVVIYKTPEEVELMDQYPTLSTSVDRMGILVGPHGRIALPLVGSIKISGLTQTAAAAKIARLYRRTFKRATVYLEVVNKRAYILGEVRHPGVLKLDRGSLTLLEAVAMSGDLTDSAVRTEILIISHARNGKMVMRAVDLTRFDHLNDASMMILPNDIVYVKPDKWRKTKAHLNDVLPMLSAVGSFVTPVKDVRTITR
jgi:polysaccharide export outer membrane protein